MRLFDLFAPFPSLGMLPTGETGWIYYVVCAVVFLMMGLFCGYLIWRKGHLQTLEAESEVAKASRELRELREALRTEEGVLRTEEDTKALGKAVSSAHD